jgi:replicative DNA helicase
MSNPEYYAEQVSKNAGKRRATEGILNIAKTVGDDDEHATSLKLTQLAEDVERHAPKKKNKKITLADNQRIFKENVHYRQQHKNLRLGFSNLDNTIGGMEPRATYVVCARTSIGKTAFVSQLARNVANQGKKALYFSLEMSHLQLWTRFSCGYARVDANLIRDGNATPAQVDQVIKAGEYLAKLYEDRLTIRDDVFTVGKMYEVCLEEKPDMVVVDYLDEIDWGNPDDKENIWRGKALKYLGQHIAKRLGASLWVVHQLNREIEGRSDKKPKLSDLRWDGTIEQAADVVLGISRPDEKQPTTTHVDCLKNRLGPGAGDGVTLQYNLEEQWFVEPGGPLNWIVPPSP